MTNRGYGLMHDCRCLMFRVMNDRRGWLYLRRLMMLLLRQSLRVRLGSGHRSIVVSVLHRVGNFGLRLSRIHRAEMMIHLSVIHGSSGIVLNRRIRRGDGFIKLTRLTGGRYRGPTMIGRVTQARVR